MTCGGPGKSSQARRRQGHQRSGHRPEPSLPLLGGKQPWGHRAILGPQQPSQPLELPGGQHSTDFYVEGLAFPDASFPGLISLTVSLLDTSNPVGRLGWVQSPAGGW